MYIWVYSSQYWFSPIFLHVWNDVCQNWTHSCLCVTSELNWIYIYTHTPASMPNNKILYSVKWNVYKIGKGPSISDGHFWNPILGAETHQYIYSYCAVRTRHTHTYTPLNPTATTNTKKNNSLEQPTSNRNTPIPTSNKHPFIIQNSHSVTLINTPQNALYYHNFSNIIAIITLVFKQNKTKHACIQVYINK